MTLIYPTADNIDTTTRYSTITTPALANGDTLFVDRDISVVATAGDAVDTDDLYAYSLINYGTIAAFGIAVHTYGMATPANISIVNGDTGIMSSSDSYTLYVGDNSGLKAGSRLSFANDGQILAADDGNGAILMFFVETVTFENSGLIHSAAIDSSYTSVVFHGVTNVRFNNSGEITGSSEAFTGANYDDVAAVGFGNGTDDVVVRNSGIITAPLYSIGSDAVTHELIINSGTLNGSVVMSNSIGGVLQNSGEIWGDVEMRGGDDDYRGYGDGFVSGTVFGGAGVDALIGSHAGDVFDGGSENDILRGRIGDDTLLGGTEDDRLYGDEGNDRLVGDAGSDTLFGGADEDALVGGNGLDVLFGGAGADTFIYNTFADSEEGGLFDRIRDFTPGEDKISLSGVAAGIDFVTSFTGTGPEVRAFLTSAGLQLVQVDYNGDGVADMRIALLGTTELATESDFIL